MFLSDDPGIEYVLGLWLGGVRIRVRVIRLGLVLGLWLGVELGLGLGDTGSGVPDTRGTCSGVPDTERSRLCKGQLRVIARLRARVRLWNTRVRMGGTLG